MILIMYSPDNGWIEGGLAVFSICGINLGRDFILRKEMWVLRLHQCEPLVYIYQLGVESPLKRALEEHSRTGNTVK